MVKNTYPVWIYMSNPTRMLAHVMDASDSGLAFEEAGRILAELGGTTFEIRQTTVFLNGTHRSGVEVYDPDRSLRVIVFGVRLEDEFEEFEPIAGNA